MNEYAMETETSLSCEYCREARRHLDGCPEGDTMAVQIWKAGRAEALMDRANTLAHDPTYTLGYTMGEMEREALNRTERPSAPDDTFPEFAPNDRPSRAPFSVSEFSLLVDEVRNEPPTTPGYEVPAVLDPFEVMHLELKKREDDLY